MKKFLAVPLLIDVIAGGILLFNAPDLLSGLFVVLMLVIIFAGLFFGIRPLLKIIRGLDKGEQSITRVAESDSETPWQSVNGLLGFFENRYLDDTFDEYKKKVNAQRSLGQMMSDIEDYINEDGISLVCWHNVVGLIPGTLTGLGILGTFIGLIIGINNLSFDDTTTALASVKTLLEGINVAFYTSISGLILSLIFNLAYRLIRNVFIRQLGLFTEDFHKYIIPSVEEQERYRQKREAEKVMHLLARLPEDPQLVNQREKEASALSSRVLEALKQKQFVPYYQPIYDLKDHHMTMMKMVPQWIHPSYGPLREDSYKQNIIKNGALETYDRMLWEETLSSLDTYDRIIIHLDHYDLSMIDGQKILMDYIDQAHISHKAIIIALSMTDFLSAHHIMQSCMEAFMFKGFDVVLSDFHGDFALLDGLTSDLLSVPVSQKENWHKEDLRHLIAKAQELHKTVIADDIEDEMTLSLLKEEGFPYGAGNYLKKPVSLDDLHKQISR
ncbi:MAG: EAL domain-containing protein [Intestinibaculum porci]|uniref:EAL domain-containing protein n=1 Tax=Intestinibaculum porci TaxID=2487118 RepID=UPI00240A5FF5|nr:EAL domain-containing protein [Intestinibaculum porci]MDD6422130.1 EAL domain-containing protein [Intestinibaculum porci]